jgi:hypothetical protein
MGAMLLARKIGNPALPLRIDCTVAAASNCQPATLRVILHLGDAAAIT